MAFSSTRTGVAVTFVAAWVALSGPAAAQNSGGFLNDVFGQRPAQRQTQVAQDDSELVVRLERLENQLRQLTGSIEQLQFRNQQLEQQLKRMQDDTEYRFQELGTRGGSRAPAAAVPGAGAPVAPPAPAQAAPGRRGDVFDPTQSPTAPGVPRTLGALPSNGVAPPADTGAPVISGNEPPVGVPGGRSPGSPLDLSTLSGAAASDPALGPGGLPPPPPRNPNATGAGSQMAAVPPAGRTAKDEFDAAYGALLGKNYAQADEGLRGFLKRYPKDKLAPDAEFWLGESLFQRQLYRDAAESFLRVSTKYGNPPKAPDALLRLAQSLGALGEKVAACGALGEIGKKYPTASASVKQGVALEQKRAKC